MIHCCSIPAQTSLEYSAPIFISGIKRCRSLHLTREILSAKHITPMILELYREKNNVVRRNIEESSASCGGFLLTEWFARMKVTSRSFFIHPLEEVNLKSAVIALITLRLCNSRSDRIVARSRIINDATRVIHHWFASEWITGHDICTRSRKYLRADDATYALWFPVVDQCP